MENEKIVWKYSLENEKFSQEQDKGPVDFIDVGAKSEQLIWCLNSAKQPFNFKANFQDKPFLFLYNRQMLGQFFSEVPEILVIGPQGQIEKR